MSGDCIEIESEKEIVVNVDGEAIYGKKIRMQIRPGAVNFVVPANMKYFTAMPETAEA